MLDGVEWSKLRLVSLTPPPPPPKVLLNRRLDGIFGEGKNLRTVTLTETATFLSMTNCSSVNQRKIPTDTSTNSKENFTVRIVQVAMC
jgi:hypothetical protein